MEDLIPTRFILLKILLQADLILLVHVTHRYRSVFSLITDGTGGGADALA
jgi:hypothetical protein